MRYFVARKLNHGSNSCIILSKPAPRLVSACYYGPKHSGHRLTNDTEKSGGYCCSCNSTQDDDPEQSPSVFASGRLEDGRQGRLGSGSGHGGHTVIGTTRRRTSCVREGGSNEDSMQVVEDNCKWTVGACVSKSLARLRQPRSFSSGRCFVDSELELIVS